MNRRAIFLLRAGTVLLSLAMFLPEARTMLRSGIASSGMPKGEYFHGGKTGVEVPANGGCISAKCHRSPSHPRRGPESAFINMHEPVVPCLGCHGKDPERHWKVPDPSTEERTFRVAYSLSEIPGNPHELKGPSARCPRCHSGNGRQALTGAGVKGLADGFESPIPMRMLEGVGRKWLTEDAR